MDIKLTEDEKKKYDDTYERITSQYSKQDKQLLEEDEIAKHVLKQMILNYVINGVIPDCSSTSDNTSDNNIIESHYDATIPLGSKEDEVCCARTEGSKVLEEDELISNLKIDNVNN